jgi:hypothetical protein
MITKGTPPCWRRNKAQFERPANVRRGVMSQTIATARVARIQRRQRADLNGLRLAQ